MNSDIADYIKILSVMEYVPQVVDDRNTIGSKTYWNTVINIKSKILLMKIPPTSDFGLVGIYLQLQKASCLIHVFPCIRTCCAYCQGRQAISTPIQLQSL